MMPFFGMGEDQLADSWLGVPETVDTERASGDDGTVEKIDLMKHMHLQFEQFQMKLAQHLPPPLQILIILQIPLHICCAFQNTLVHE